MALQGKYKNIGKQLDEVYQAAMRGSGTVNKNCFIVNKIHVQFSYSISTILYLISILKLFAYYYKNPYD